MSFKKIRRPTVSLESPESMYKDIHPRKIEGLLSHQADVLRSYEENAAPQKDVALQMPTGSGKTLVGAIIAEWRRRKLGERVVYICPTRQLSIKLLDIPLMTMVSRLTPSRDRKKNITLPLKLSGTLATRSE
jgi:CRISPR/Cas system-associated endonuclease/helicase Cas3